MSLQQLTPPSIFTRCNLSPWVIASVEFQRDPHPLHLHGERRGDERLYAKLDGIDDPAERSRVFEEYLTVKFRLHEWSEYQGPTRSSLRSDYARFLHGWGMDSNGHAGAVLKMWAQSRFGLEPTHHGGRLPDDPQAAEKFRRDAMNGAAKTPGVFMQLDMLHAIAQYELTRRRADARWLTLYRGTHDPEEYVLHDHLHGGDAPVVRFNNLSSFTADVEVAWEFGSLVWEVQVPVAKVVCFAGLLPHSTLAGEAEYLVLGGDYVVRPRLF